MKIWEWERKKCNGCVLLLFSWKFTSYALTLFIANLFIMILREMEDFQFRFKNGKNRKASSDQKKKYSKTRLRNRLFVQKSVIYTILYWWAIFWAFIWIYLKYLSVYKVNLIGLMHSKVTMLCENTHAHNERARQKLILMSKVNFMN